MATIDEMIASGVAAGVSSYKAELQAAKDAAQADIVAQQNALSTAASTLDAQFKGFLTGAIPPAYQTSNANMTVRDPFYGQTNVVASASKTSPMIYVLAGAAVWYFFLRKRR